MTEASEKLHAQMTFQEEVLKIRGELKLFTDGEMRDMCKTVTGRAGKNKYDAYQRLVAAGCWDCLLKGLRRSSSAKRTRQIFRKHDSEARKAWWQ